MNGHEKRSLERGSPWSPIDRWQPCNLFRLPGADQQLNWRHFWHPTDCQALTFWGFGFSMKAMMFNGSILVSTLAHTQQGPSWSTTVPGASSGPLPRRPAMVPSSCSTSRRPPGAPGHSLTTWRGDRLGSSESLLYRHSPG